MKKYFLKGLKIPHIFPGLSFRPFGMSVRQTKTVNSVKFFSKEEFNRENFSKEEFLIK
jgi:hypothetical protein